MEVANLHEWRVGAVARGAEVGRVDAGESIGGHPVAAGAGNLLGVEFGRDASGVEVGAPVGREIEREGEIDGFGRADVGLQEAGGDTNIGESAWSVIR